MYRMLLSLLTLLAVAVCPSVSEAQQAPAAHLSERGVTRNPIFAVPPRLRPRVDFWISIFAKLGKYQMLMHHREYPQAIFAQLDFRREAGMMGDKEFEKYKKARVAELTDRVYATIKKLSTGAEPQGAFEQQISDAMRMVPGPDRYKDILEDKELIRTQTGIHERWAEAIQRSGRHKLEMERIFAQARLPIELTCMPFIESSFDYEAYSSVGAAGIWQFMPRTGRHFMTVTKTVDERRDPIVATHAAARYLAQSYNTLGSWPLAITAYNHGVSGVARKVLRFGTTDISQLIERVGEKPFGFASTNFYPEFLAALDVYENRRTLFPEIEPEPAQIVKLVPLPKSSSVSQVARTYGVSIETLRATNYALTNRVWDGRSPIPKGYHVRLPTAAPAAPIAMIEAAAEEAPEVDRNASTAIHRVRKGETLAGIAKRYGVTIAQLLAANSMSAEDSIRKGQQITIPRVPPAPVHRKKIVPKKPAMRVYVVRSGDSLQSIAKHFKVTVKGLKDRNHLSSNALRAGQRLSIP